MTSVLVTGAGRGLGLEFVRQFAADGCDVVATVRDPAKGRPLAELGAPVEVHLADMTDLRSIERLGQDLRNHPIDVLVCNAALYGPRNAHIGKTDYAAWADVMRVNVMAPVAVVEALLPSLSAGQRKTVVLLSSRMGSIAETSSGGSHIYRSSKAALNMMTRCLAADLRKQGFIVVALSPGWVKTDMGGPGAALTPETSVANMRALISRLTHDDTGRFFNHDGTEIAW